MLDHRIFDVRSFDGPMLMATSALMAFTWFVATWWAARRASEKDPAIGLKEI
jgi:ABC-type lipoprotein release transport system permease subunit